MRPMAAAISRLAIWASSIRLVSSRERKLRHQSSDGGADCPCPAPYLGGISGASSGRVDVKMHPVSIGTRHNPTNTTKTGRRLVDAVTPARVRHSSNMGPTFNARTPVKRGSSVNATHAFPQSPDNQLTILSTPPGPTKTFKYLSRNDYL